MEKVRSLGYPTLPSYYLSAEDTEGLHMESIQAVLEVKLEDEEDSEGEGATSDGAQPENKDTVKAGTDALRGIEQRLADWCNSMVRKMRQSDMYRT
jgi:hypothetical protein